MRALQTQSVGPSTEGPALVRLSSARGQQTEVVPRFSRPLPICVGGGCFLSSAGYKNRRYVLMKLYDELKARGLVAQITDEEIIDVINEGKATFYIGFDCTADSLTAGHFMALTLMKRLQMAGAADGRQQAHRPDRRRHHHDRRPLRPHRYAQDADAGGHRAQRRLLQKADGAVHRLRRGQGHHAEQRRLAAQAELHRAAAGGGRLLLGQQYAAGRVLQAADGEGPVLPRVQLHDSSSSTT